MLDISFESFPKMHRLNGPVIVTEKIDGTNAQVIITEDNQIAAASRTRIITPGKDNFGFLTWVDTHRNTLIETLGPGRHYGEWWGNGIQRGYNKKEKCFSLFNTFRWSELDFSDNYFGLWVVPVLFSGTFVEVIAALSDIMRKLKETGSEASPGYMNPEGVVIYDTRSGQGYKKTFDYDDTGKQAQRDEHQNVLTLQ